MKALAVPGACECGKTPLILTMPHGLPEHHFVAETITSHPMARVYRGIRSAFGPIGLILFLMSGRVFAQSSVVTFANVQFADGSTAAGSVTFGTANSVTSASMTRFILPGHRATQTSAIPLKSTST